MCVTKYENITNVEEEEEEGGGEPHSIPFAPPPSSPKLKDWRKKEIKKEKRGEIK